MKWLDKIFIFCNGGWASVCRKLRIFIFYFF